MSFCPNCGTNVGDAPYCPTCGTPQPRGPGSAIAAPFGGATAAPSPLPQTSVGVWYASWGQRAAALLIDLLVLFGIGIGVGVVSAVVTTGRARGGSGIFTFGELVVPVLYFTIMHGRDSGQTVGKMAVGIAVKDVDTGQPIGYGRALGRYLIQIPIGLLIFIGPLLDYLWPLWDERHQCWHDKVVRSSVFRVN